MKKSRFINFLMIAFSISILGFILDLNERVPNIWVNIIDISLMTIILFCVLSTALLIVNGVKLLFSRISN